MKHELFVCQCESLEHQIIISECEDNGEHTVYVSIHLSPSNNIWTRIKNAVKHIFGYRSKYGDFDEFIVNSRDADKLQKVVNYLKSTPVS